MAIQEIQWLLYVLLRYMLTENAVLTHSPQCNVNAVQAYSPQCIVMSFHTPLFGRVCLYKAISLIWQSHLHTHTHTHTLAGCVASIHQIRFCVHRPMGTPAILP